MQGRRDREHAAREHWRLRGDAADVVMDVRIIRGALVSHAADARVRGERVPVDVAAALSAVRRVADTLGLGGS
jgi:hypothetical protein